MMGSGAIGLSIYSYVDHVVFSCLSDPDVLDCPSTLCEEYVKVRSGVCGEERSDELRRRIMSLLPKLHRRF